MKEYLNDSKWEELFRGKSIYKFENLGFSMMISRLSRQFRKQPKSLSSCINEANSFCDKYNDILKNDLAKLKMA